MTVKGAWTTDKVRARIRTTVIIKRLENHCLGVRQSDGGEMTDSQRKAAECLLRKTLPDLATITHKGDADAPLALILEGSDKHG